MQKPLRKTPLSGNITLYYVKARSHRQNFAGAVLERYGDESNFDNARHRAQNLGEYRKHGRC